MMLHSPLPLILAAVLIASDCSVAVAGETFICERNRIVTATPDTLETLKRTDPCVAAYFGLEVEGAAGSPKALKQARSDNFTREVFIGVEAVGAAPEAPHERLTRLKPADTEKAAKRHLAVSSPKLVAKPRRVRSLTKATVVGPGDLPDQSVMPVIHVINAGS